MSKYVERMFTSHKQITDLLTQDSPQDHQRRNNQNSPAQSMFSPTRQAPVPCTLPGTSTTRETRSGSSLMLRYPAPCSQPTSRGKSHELYLFHPTDYMNRFYKPKLHKIVKDPYAEKQVTCIFQNELKF